MAATYIHHPSTMFLRLRESVRRCKDHVWFLEGLERSTQAPLTIGYAGSRANKSFISHLAFGTPPKEQYRGKSWIWDVPKTSPDSGARCNVVVAEVNPALRYALYGTQGFYLPTWVGVEADLAASAVRFKQSKNVKTDIDTIRKNGFSYDVASDEKRFDEFYYNMYVPYIAKVYADRAFVTSYNDMKKSLSNSELILVKRGDEYISGTMLVREKGRVRGLSLGVKNGDTSLVKAGAIAASYYFSITHLLERGHKKLHFGASRPMLRDGVLQFKKKWGINIVDATDKGLCIMPRDQSGGVKGFLLNNPFIYREKGKLYGGVFSDQGADDNSLKRLHKDYYLPGMACMNVHNFENSSMSVPAEFAGQIAVKAASQWWRH